MKSGIWRGRENGDRELRQVREPPAVPPQAAPTLDKVERRRLRERVDEPAAAPSPGSSARTRLFPGEPASGSTIGQMQRRGRDLRRLTVVGAKRIGPPGFGSLGVEVEEGGGGGVGGQVYA